MPEFEWQSRFHDWMILHTAAVSRAVQRYLLATPTADQTIFFQQVNASPAMGEVCLN